MADYSEYTKEQLIDLLKRRDAQTPLGIVWERNEIDHDKALNDDFVALNLHPDLSIGDAPWTNLLIEGDNFDALRYLRMTFKGRIKVICIDPPYNTGNKDFIYNDNYINKDDNFKHSKWLEFMYRRLILAKELLCQDGVIFVNIGDEEFGHLSMLMDKVFPGMKVATFVWKRRSGANDAKGAFVSPDHEYVLCYANPGFSFAGENKDMSAYSNPDNDPKGDWTLIRITCNKTQKERPNTYYPIYNAKRDVWYPCSLNRVWAYASKSRLKPGQKIRTKTIEDYIEDGKVIFPENDRIEVYNSKDDLIKAIRQGSAPYNLREESPDIDFFIGKRVGFGTVQMKKYSSELKRSQKPLSTWIVPINEKIDNDESQHLQTGYTSEGTKLIQHIMGSKTFNYPKPKSLIKALLSQSTTPNGSDIVMDFFGGSGTTAHALLELNAEDDGERRFIVVSSPEATGSEPDKNICRDITRLRLERTIKGYSYRSGKSTKEVEPVPGDFAYLTMKRIPKESVGLKISHEQIWIALQMINDSKLNPYNTVLPFQSVEMEDLAIIYIATITNEVVSALGDMIKRFSSAIIYSWEPGILRRQITRPGCVVEKIPDYLVHCFGGE